MSGVVPMGPGLHLPGGSRLLSRRPLASAARAAVFLDRDGVILEDVHFLTNREELRILPGAAEALRALEGQFYLIIVTNQSGIARGLLSEEDLLGIHTDLVNRLGVEGAVLDALYYCPHLPEASVEAYRLACDCRKPKPGMLRRAQKDWDIDLARSFMVGDMPRDAQAAQAAGVRAISLRNQGCDPSGANWDVSDLAQAGYLILAQSGEVRTAPTPGSLV